MLRSFFISIFLMLSLHSFSQFEPTEYGNFFELKDQWLKYFDSIRINRITNGDSTMTGTGFNQFNRWVTYWEQFMPASGNFVEAAQIREQINLQQKKEHFLSITGAQTNALIAQPVNWTEIGPINNSAIKKKVSSSWLNPHLSNDGTQSFAGHNAKIDRLFVHPNNEDVIFACAGGYENGGGGLYRSIDGGNSWTILGTDKIPNPIVTAFAIKPLGSLPNPDIEVLFIGLGTGAVYRSIDDGITWLEAGYNGVVNYPFVNTAQITNSLPYSFDFLNITGIGKLDALKYAPKINSGGEYERLIVAREGGLFYSDNSSASITVSTNTLINNIIWNQFDLSGIVSQINLLDNSSLTKFFVTDFEYFTKNGQVNYVAHLLLREYYLNAEGNPVTTTVRQFVISSADFGSTWSFLGGYSSANTIQGTIVSTSAKSSFFDPGNIECVISEPNYIYVASGNPSEFSYTLKRFSLTSSPFWTDLSEYSGAYNGKMSVQAHAFAINPFDDEELWIANNFIRHIQNGVIQTIPMSYSYGTGFHADGRDLLILENGKMLLGTDGGVYQSSISSFTGVFNVTSEGLNAAQSSLMAVTQQPPFYVFSGFWHSGIQIFDPKTGDWHWGSAGDGKGGTSLFLNNSRYFITDQTYNLHGYKDFNSLSNVPTQLKDGNVCGSENIIGRAYGTKRDLVWVTSSIINESESRDEIKFTNNDFNTHNNLLTSYSTSPYPISPEEMIFPFGSTSIFTIPNSPDKLIVLSQISGDKKMHIYSGLNSVTPIPVLDKTIDILSLHENAYIIDVEFDTRNNNLCWIVLRPDALWTSDETMRIIEFDLLNETYTDISYVLDNITVGSPNTFPTYITINSIERDRQTGTLYIGTTNGIYYLDADNQIWRKYSKNIPLFNTDLGIVHCTGEIYASSNYRGIWKAGLIRADNPTQEWKITQNETWNDRMNLFCTLVIEPGVTLTVKDDLVVYGFQKIIVKPGGRLIVDGGKITTECGDYWAGIEVWGNSSQFQNSLNQGHLIVRNGGIIEFAQNAVLVGKEGDASKGGGLVQAANSTFRNNINCVKYLPYNFYSLATGNEILNKGRFINCEFLWDDNFIGEDVHAGLDLNHVNGVIITGCTIRDDRTTVTNPHERPFGIISLDAGYKVIGRNTGPLNSPIHHIYDETNMDVSYFKNLREGIYAMNALSQNSITVDHAKFEDMVYGIHVSSVDNAILTRNKFNFTFSHPSDISVMHEMAISKSTGFTIEGNIFNKQPANSIVEGVLVYNSGFDDNKIYRNVYENLYTANYANGENTNDQNGIFQPSGLEFLCNNYSLSDKYDQYVYTFPNINGNGQGVKLKQGTSTVPAGNIFSLMNPGQNKAHFHSTDSDNTIYYGYHPDPLQQLTVPGDGVGYVPVYVIDEEEYCGSNFNTVIPNGGILINSPVQLQIINELQQINFDYNTKSNELSNLLTPGDSEFLHELVGNLTAQNKTIVKNELLSYSPYLSESLLIELGEKTPSVFPPNWYKLVIEANVEVAQNKTFINYLNNKPVPLAPGLVNNIIEYALIHSTERGTKMDELTDLNSRKSTILNFLISNELSDSTEINWSIYKDFIIQRDDIICRSQLADMYLGKRETAQCDAKLDDIDVHINEYMVDEVKQEMMDYSTFKKYILNIIDSSSLIMGLTQEQIDQLNYVADNFKGKSSVQAKNLLCYLTGQCEDLIVEYASGNKSAQEFNIEDNNTFGKNLEINPNPNNGQFEVKVPNECLILNVYVNDIQGRKVDFQRESLENNRLKLDIDEAFSGLYLITIECEDTTYTSRIIIK